ncbi:MAG: C1 family peptidase [Treponema sp.]|nr:C1 family peptidase [Treponema sp.]
MIVPTNFRRVKALLLMMFYLTAAAALYAQTFPRGAVLDPVLYDSLPQKAVQVSRAYESLPTAASLKQYAPEAGNQGMYGTCTAWSSAYAARTILESIALNRWDRQAITSNVFSPNFVYKNLFIFNGQPDDPAGQRGAAISWALNFMRDKGPVKMLDREKQLDFRAIPSSLYANSRAYPIAGYATLFRSDTQRQEDKILMVKKSLAESKPVVIGMNCPNSFFAAHDVWRPRESPAGSYGGHAMCVVGYDDAKYNGAFEVQNSWGDRWGNAGFTWIPYDVFASFVFEAYGLSENLGNYQSTVQFAGFADIEVRGGAGMSVSYRSGYYETLSPYLSGTRFRYLLGNREPAYVYAFAADDTSAAPTQIFPLAGSNVSPLLDYSENLVAFPGEFDWIQLDDQVGTDYLVVLYSKKELNIAAIRATFARERGSFPDRVARAVGSGYIPPSQANYEPNRLAFTAASANPNAVFGLLLAIQHQ